MYLVSPFLVMKRRFHFANLLIYAFTGRVPFASARRYVSWRLTFICAYRLTRPLRGLGAEMQNRGIARQKHWGALGIVVWLSRRGTCVAGTKTLELP